MAFKTRGGRTVAQGNGAVVTATALWMVSLLLLAGPTSVAVAYGLWLIAPILRRPIAQTLPELFALAILAVAVLLFLRVCAGACSFGGFFGPSHRPRDVFAAYTSSRTARLAFASAVMLIFLLVALRYPLGALRPIAISALTFVVLALDVAATRGLFRIVRASRSAHYFEGMSEDQKAIADVPSSVARKPSFPAPSALESADDAGRYARRASAIASYHTWTGAGLIVVFSAFVGTTIPALWESKAFPEQVPMYVVLGALALGFLLQRRARSYEALAEAFFSRETELVSAAKRATRSGSIARLRSVVRTLPFLRHCLSGGAAGCRRTPQRGHRR